MIGAALRSDEVLNQRQPTSMVSSLLQGGE